jgi:tetratricopeptide (TPR) repeat protein
MSLSVDQSIRKAQRCAKTGDTIGAGALYNSVLEKFPGNARALKGLSALGGAAYAHPSAAPPRNKLDALVALLGQGEFAAVIEQTTALCRQFPASFALNNILGIANARLGRQSEAVAHYEKSIALNPAYASAHYNLGNSWRDLGRLQEAIGSYTNTLEVAPGFADAALNLGNILIRLGREKEAIGYFKKILALKPGDARAYNNLGDTLIELGRYTDAVANLTRALDIQPDFAEAHNNLGNAFRKLGRHDDAVARYNLALELKPDYADAHNNLGAALTDLGCKEAAIASYTAALQFEPGLARTHRNLSTIKRFEAGDPQIGEITKLLADKALPDDDRAQLNFALGKAMDDLGDYKKAFACFAEGHRLRKKLLAYSASTDREQFRAIRSVFESDKNPFQSRNLRPDRCSPAPIFIIGMPRSGTSLVEQVLASHSEVHGAGELSALEEAVNASGLLQATPSPARLETLAQHYSSSLTKLGVNEPYIIDKMPLNFRWIGFIRQALPEAKIIHTQRDARATCWSIFRHYFSTSGNGYAYDLSDLAEFYNLYTNLMSFWEILFPGEIYHLNYERLTEHQEGEIRKLLSYAGLAWEDQCLEPHKTQRAVATASALQVKEKIYTGSSEAWRNYEKFLGALTARLNAN